VHAAAVHYDLASIPAYAASKRVCRLATHVLVKLRHVNSVAIAIGQQLATHFVVDVDLRVEQRAHRISQLRVTHTLRHTIPLLHRAHL
jgi:hypothetical protein